MRVILASASPRRKELLALLEMPFEIITSGIEEKVTKTAPSEVVEELSLQKAQDVMDRVRKEINEKTESQDTVQKNALKDDAESGNLQEGILVIGADTVVSIDGMILGKPKDEEDAFQMLQHLSGRSHEVFTGVSLLHFKEGKVDSITFSERTEVVFQTLSEAEIREYIATKEPMDKAGSYGIQALGAKFVKEIHGDYFNVVGLPVSAIYKHLREF